jgi:hypothetical protein
MGEVEHGGFGSALDLGRMARVDEKDAHRGLAFRRTTLAGEG